MASHHLEMSLPKEAVEDEIAERKAKDLSDSEIGLDKLEKEELLSEDEKVGHPEVHETVDCECVNGTCKPGQATCAACNHGWHGTLCDLPIAGISPPAQQVVSDDEFGLFDNDLDAKTADHEVHNT